MLDIIRNVNINVTLITKKNGILNKIDLEKYNSQYKNLNVYYNSSFHDRYFIVDEEIFYHCGTSLNHIGEKTFSINILEDNIVKGMLLKKIKSIINIWKICGPKLGP